MPRAVQETILDLKGGYSTDSAPSVRAPVAHLNAAENVTFELSGARRKMGGATRVNSVALTAAPAVVGMYDFWLTGTGGTSTQKFVAVGDNSKIFKADSGSGTFTDITGGASITVDATPVFCQAYDLLTIFNDKNDTPLKWNQTGNVATLGGSPPSGRGMVFHANRGWTWGDNSNPSRITYSSSTDIEDFTGMDTGSIDIDPEDGDRIIGAVSHKQRLIIFKGPYRGSIHEISGLAVADFARAPLVRGIPLQTHNSIVSVGDDVWFMSDRGIHSLQATEQFGNFKAFDLTKDLTGYFRDSINRSRMDRVWGVNYDHRNSAIWTLAPSGSSTHNEAIGLSYVKIVDGNIGLQPFLWKTHECHSAAIRINATSMVHEIVFGTSDGFIERQDTTSYTLGDGVTGYTYRVKTPSVILGTTDAAGQLRGDQPVTLHSFYVRSNPASPAGDLSVTVTRDDGTTSSHTLSQDTSINNLQVASDNLTGDTRDVQLDITQAVAGESAEIYEVGIRWTPTAASQRTSL